jgi:hypothetical protein
MSEQLDLFDRATHACSTRTDMTPLIWCPPPLADQPHASGYAVAHGLRWHGGSNARIGPATECMPLVTPQGELVQVPVHWTLADRLTVFNGFVDDAVGHPVAWQRLGRPRAAFDLPAQRSGNLFVRPDRDLIVRINGAKGGDESREDASLHITRAHHEAMRARQHAFQGIVTRVMRPGCLGLLVVAAIPYAVLEPLVSEMLDADPGRSRAALSCAVEVTASGIALRIPEADVEVTQYAGVEALAAHLRGHTHEPWRALAHADWSAIVAAVLTRRDGLACSVSPLDTGAGLNRHRLREIGIDGVYAHQLGLPAACTEDLVRTDVVGAPVSRDLRAHPKQPLVAVEVDHRSEMSAVEQLVRRAASAGRLGLTIGTCVVVADEEKRAAFERRAQSVPAHVRRRLEFWPMHELYATYQRLRDEHLRSVALVARPYIRRAA